MSILLMLSSLQVLQSPEEMYGSYDKDGKYRKMREKMEQISERLEKDEEAREEKKTWALGFALVIGLFPLVFIGAQVVRGKTWETNLTGTIQSLGIALGGGILLFVFNYGFFYLKVLHNNLFQYVFSLAVFLGIIIGAVLLLRKQKRKN